MNKYSFNLTPAYCLFNGIGIYEQKGAYIKFLIENPNDELLKNRLIRSFNEHISNIAKIKGDDSLKVENAKVEFLNSNRTQIREYVSTLYAKEGQKVGNSFERKSKNDEAAAVLLLDRLLSDGRKKKATDIHIEDKSIRFRINGVLEYQMSISGKRYKELIQRIKLLSGMNLLEKRRSQDGNFVYGGKNPLFVRASSVYLVNDSYEGEESIVLRLLDTTRVPLSIYHLGFTQNQIERILKLSSINHGLILVCGPTGAGKSTTVASILVEMEKNYQKKLKIISLEDPPEYVIPGISQIKINNEKNNFNETLNHVFRLDPDVIMIGEIRDEVSAAVALKASLTGHLVFATLHTGSVSESILRLENLGLPRKLLCSVLRGVICQELNFDEDHLRFYADIGIPTEKFSSKITKEMSEDDIEALFIHETNYSSLLNKTLEMFTNRDSVLTKNENMKSRRKKNKNQFMWREKKNGKVYKRIV